MYSYDRPFVLAVENPLDSTLDVGKNSYNMPLLKTALAEAYIRLHNVLVSPPAGKRRREGGREGGNEGGDVPLRLFGFVSGL
jgi:DNA polymerase sigma